MLYTNVLHLLSHHHRAAAAVAVHMLLGLHPLQDIPIDDDHLLDCNTVMRVIHRQGDIIILTIINTNYLRQGVLQDKHYQDQLT